MPVWHVQKHVKHVQPIVKESQEWNNAKNCAGLAQLHVANVPRIVKIPAAMLSNHYRIAWRLVAHVPKNVESPKMNHVKNVQMHVINVQLSAARYRKVQLHEQDVIN